MTAITIVMIVVAFLLCVAILLAVASLSMYARNILISSARMDKGNYSENDNKSIIDLQNRKTPSIPKGRTEYFLENKNNRQKFSITIIPTEKKLKYELFFTRALMGHEMSGYALATASGQTLQLSNRKGALCLGAGNNLPFEITSEGDLAVYEFSAGKWIVLTESKRAKGKQIIRSFAKKANKQSQPQ